MPSDHAPYPECKACDHTAMPFAASLIRTTRLIHLYIGVFIAPAVLFFAFTGVMQTFSFHESTKGSDYKPAQWMVVVAQLHKKQTTNVPVRRGPPPGATLRAETKLSVPPMPPVPAEKPHDPLPMKVYFAVVSAGLTISTFTGVYMAYKFTRNKSAISAALIAGIIAPLILLVTA